MSLTSSLSRLQSRLSSIQQRMAHLQGDRRPARAAQQSETHGGGQESLAGGVASQGARAGHFRALVQAAGQREGVSPELLQAVIKAESGGRADARSPKGALGLMQLMPSTARELGVDPRLPDQNVTGGARYLRQMGERFGSLDGALAAYNAGPGAVERHGGVPPFKETREYIARVRAYLGQSKGSQVDLQR